MLVFGKEFYEHGLCRFSLALTPRPWWYQRSFLPGARRATVAQEFSLPLSGRKGAGAEALFAPAAFQGPAPQRSRYATPLHIGVARSEPPQDQGTRVVPLLRRTVHCRMEKRSSLEQPPGELTSAGTTWVSPEPDPAFPPGGGGEGTGWQLQCMWVFLK